MNLSCKQVVIISSNGMAGNQNAECRAFTTHGRTHCHAHRTEEIKRLSQAKVQAREAYEAAEKAFDVYFHEGTGL